MALAPKTAEGTDMQCLSTVMEKLIKDADSFFQQFKSHQSRMREIVEKLKGISEEVHSTPEEDEKLRNCIIQSADKTQSLVDECAVMKTDLREIQSCSAVQETVSRTEEKRRAAFCTRAKALTSSTKSSFTHRRLSQEVMWELLLIFSLLCWTSEGSVTCRNENNGEVDWYILYKTPSIKNQLQGVEYLYIDSHGMRTANKAISDSQGVLANTLKPLFNPGGSMRQKWIMTET
ncbi:uncharacterized protein LOC113026158 [Astatotilapia calliptera]|uniref:uncharacterized protein LOC113026158 n=1 Tax=Astatotilapia calliptera TaxID=8154 RepID=UPI000E403765|nr:uncharacterized protein LOC113026158 [Astatotilapia calliptera]